MILKAKNWFVVYTKPKQEIIAVQNLERQGYKIYFPQIWQSRIQQRRCKKIVEPLFPRYLFIQLDVKTDNFSPIRSTVGVVGLVKFGFEPAFLPDQLIEIIRQQENDLNDMGDFHSDWQSGDVLQILDGPFMGMEGIFQKRQSTERVTVLLDILGKQNKFSVQIDCLAKAR